MRLNIRNLPRNFILIFNQGGHKKRKTDAWFDSPFILPLQVRLWYRNDRYGWLGYAFFAQNLQGAVQN